MRAVRVVLRSAVAALSAVVVMSSAAVPASADPSDDLKDAKEKVLALDAEASEVGEELELATESLDKGKEQLRVLNEDIKTQQAKVDTLAVQARRIALVQFQGRGVDNTVALLTESDPDSFLARLSTTSAVGETMTTALADYQSAEADLVSLKRSAEVEVAALADEEKRLSELDSELDTKLDEAKALVATLTAREQAALAARSGMRVSFDISELDEAEVSAKIKKVIAYAVAQVPNGSYVWGASGPKGFDCSGLMLAAYRQIGVSLPHSSRTQSTIGRAVSRDELQPGDLIFWYRPIHHVGMYIGNGKIVHARNVRDDLVVQTLNSYPAPWAGARRILG